LYQTLVQTIILYNSETWTLKEEQKRKLRVFEMSVLRKICGVTRRDHRRKLDVLKELDIHKDVVQLFKSCRHTDWRISRMGSDRYPHLLLYGYIHGRQSSSKKKTEEEVVGQHLWRLQGDGHYNLWGFTTRYQQGKMEEHCTPYGLQARTDNVIVATAISQVSKSSNYAMLYGNKLP